MGSRSGATAIQFLKNRLFLTKFKGVDYGNRCATHFYIKKYPTRIDCNVNGKKGQIVIDQIRSIDITRLIKKISIIYEATSEKVYKTILAYFN